jgi:hypothetical protein
MVIVRPASLRGAKRRSNLMGKKEIATLRSQWQKDEWLYSINFGG